MSSEAIYEAMNTENWETVRALLAIKPEELEKRYGVHICKTASNIYELDLIFSFREKDPIMLYRIPHVDSMYVIIVFLHDIIIALPPSSV